MKNKVFSIIFCMLLPFTLHAVDTLDTDNSTLSTIDDGDAMELGDDGGSLDLSDELLGDDDELLSESAGDAFAEPESGLVFEGKIALEHRYFHQTGLSPDQDYHNNTSFLIEPSWRYEWDSGLQNIVFTPFARLDDKDSERTHADIRELLWTKESGDWTIRAGIGKVFWGVTESQHLVDVINQTDLIENTDAEEKLGQQMINVAYTSDYGTFDIFVLPGFRERTFPGNDGRLRLVPKVADDHVIYESGAKQKHVDLALRWAHTMGDWDIGLAHFHGTARDPQYVPVISGGQLVEFRTFYEIIDQTSVDAQAVKGNWLWKFEGLTRGGQGSGRFEAATAGFEYTISGVFETGADLGFLAEYLYDNRRTSELTTPFDDDVYMGMRLGMNDAQSTELLAGVIVDRDNSEWAYNVEASRRIAEGWKINLEARGFSNNDRNSLIAYAVRRDDYIKLELERFF